MDVKPEDFRLSDFVHQQKYQEIVKEFLSEKTKSDKPMITILGGQPGSGKTKMRELAEKERPSVIINADDNLFEQTTELQVR